jgi:hypothetical protein
MKIAHNILHIRQESGALYNCPKVIKTPPQSPHLNVTENLLSKLETEISFQ